jgi:beta-mannosidase
VGFDGSRLTTNNLEISIAPNSRVDVHRFPLPGGSVKDRLVFSRLNRISKADDKSPVTPVLPAILREDDIRKLPVTRPNLVVREISCDNHEMKVEISTDTFAHGVHFNLGPDYRLDDEYFDLLPGETREVTIRPRKDNHRSTNWQEVNPTPVR